MLFTAHNRRTQEIPPRFSPVFLGLDFENRETLYSRINLRVDRMLEMGLLKEIEGLLADGIPPKCTAMQAIGYKEFVAALKGTCTVAEAAEAVKQSSRRYSKRQLTWFRRNKAMHWLVRKGGDDAEIFQTARQIIQESDS